MDYTDEQLLKLDPELETLFQEKGVPKLQIPTRKTISIFRKFYNAAIKRYNESPFARAALGDAFDTPNWTECDHNVPMRDGCVIKVRTYAPITVDDDGAPVFLKVHGGGWFMGNLDTEALFCRILASKLGIVAVNLDYRLYPEVNFPVPIHDTYDVVKWIAGNASSFGGNLSKGFILGGNSGGGTYASVVTYLARDDNLQPPVTGMFLNGPILSDEIMGADGKWTTKFDHKTEYRSWWQNANAPLMNEEMRLSIRGFADFEFNSKYLSPFLFDFHGDLPPTYIGVCGLDPWRDGGVLLAQEIQKAGGVTKMDVYPGLPHCWWVTYPHLKATPRWLKNSLEGVQWLIRNTTPSNRASKL